MGVNFCFRRKMEKRHYSNIYNSEKMEISVTTACCGMTKTNTEGVLGNLETCSWKIAPKSLGISWLAESQQPRAGIQHVKGRKCLSRAWNEIKRQIPSLCP
jgi:hypothetical protein